MQVNGPPKEWRGDGAGGAFFRNHGGAVRLRAERFGRSASSRRGVLLGPRDDNLFLHYAVDGLEHCEPHVRSKVGESAQVPPVRYACETSMTP